MKQLTLKELRDFAYMQIADLEDGEVNDFRLEQAERHNQKEWDVVVSFLVNNVNQSNLPKVNLFGNFNSPFERLYKRLILKEDGSLSKFLIYKEK